MVWYILFVGMAVGTFFMHVLPGIRLHRLGRLADKIVVLGGSPPPPKLRSQLITEDEYFRALEAMDIALMHQLVSVALDAHSEVLARKKNQSLFADDYGNLRNDAWLKELRYYVRSVLFPLDTSPLGELEAAFVGRVTYQTYSDITQKQYLNYWVDYLDQLVVAEERHLYLQFQHSMSGHEYEQYVADMIQDLGWSAKVTSGSGDHGADIIAEHDGSRVAIQCKFYRTPVGNKSVQEAFSAMSFYDCDHACVVTNSSFTPAARKAAGKLGVALLHHDDIANYFAE